jgi:hypothetical protein
MITVFSLREKRMLRYIIFFVIVTRVLLMFRSEERIYTRPYIDDTFYLFSTAEHAALGDMLTVDGKQPTNGIQPLIVFLYIPLFIIAGANKLLAIKLVFLLIALFDSASVLLIALSVKYLKKKNSIEDSLWFSPPIIAAVLWALPYPMLSFTATGLETGLYSMMLLACIFYYAKLFRMRDEGKELRLMDWCIFGVLLGFTVLSRIDAVFLIISIGLFEWYRFKGKGFRSAVLISVIGFIISSPWWYYNYSTFGSIMPQSGTAESINMLLGINISRGAHALGVIFALPIPLPNPYELIVINISIFLVITGIVFLIASRLQVAKSFRREFAFSPLLPFLSFCACLIFFYVFFFSAPYFLERYFQPFRIIWVIFIACISPVIIGAVKRIYLSKQVVAFFFSLSFLAIICCNVWQYTSYFIDFRSNIFSTAWNKDFYLAGKWALVNPQKRIGMGQSGTAGFLAPNVVNLDGKVNFAALQSLKKHDIGSYIESEHLNYLMDWRGMCLSMIKSSQKHGGNFQEIDSIGFVVIFERDAHPPVLQ